MYVYMYIYIYQVLNTLLSKCYVSYSVLYLIPSVYSVCDHKQVFNNHGTLILRRIRFFLQLVNVRFY